MKIVLRGIVIAVGAAAGVAAFWAAFAVSPRACAAGPGARSQFTAASGSLLLIGGLIVFETAWFGLNLRLRTKLVTATALSLAAVGIGAFILQAGEPWCY